MAYRGYTHEVSKILHSADVLCTTSLNTKYANVLPIQNTDIFIK